jgi:hypothetical protein
LFCVAPSFVFGDDDGGGNIRGDLLRHLLSAAIATYYLCVRERKRDARAPRKDLICGPGFFFPPLFLDFQFVRTYGSFKRIGINQHESHFSFKLDTQ